MGIFSTHILFILNHAGLAFLICTAINAVKIEDCEIRSVYNCVYCLLIIINKYVYFLLLMVNEYIDFILLIVYKYVYELSVHERRKV